MDRVIKKDLIVEVSDITGIKHQDVELVIESFLERITEYLGNGGTIAIREFGTFDLRVARGKPGRNPKRPETPIMIPERYVARFRPAGKMKKRISEIPVAS